VSAALILGVDPGLSGAVAGLTPEGALGFVADLPVIRDLNLAWIDGRALQTILATALAGRSAHAVIERVWSMPKQGVSSTFQFGVGFGSILSVLQVMQVSLEFVTPGVWKKFHGLGKDKRASLHKARLLYPRAELNLANHDGRAEALLIARYAVNRRPI
jgi:crossover junction endodeoxyribonuclease RuvC